MNVFGFFFVTGLGYVFCCVFFFFFFSICMKHLNVSSHRKGPAEGKEVLMCSNSEYFFQTVFEKLVIPREGSSGDFFNGSELLRGEKWEENSIRKANFPLPILGMRTMRVCDMLLLSNHPTDSKCCAFPNYIQK